MRNVIAKLGNGIEVAQFEVFGDLQAEALGDLAEDFHLLDGVDAQVGLQIEFVFEHVGGIAGLLGDNGLDRIQQVIISGCGRRRGRRLVRGYRFGLCRGRRPGLRWLLGHG